MTTGFTALRIITSGACVTGGPATGVAASSGAAATEPSAAALAVAAVARTKSRREMGAVIGGSTVWGWREYIAAARLVHRAPPPAWRHASAWLAARTLDRDRAAGHGEGPHLLAG